ncbi:basic region leucin zipper [Yamadazyma tenuis]|uniref:BZIP domain-containing protein n=1 Tax=Candida tenuis (strain ATCC 10573 / BCRC 21748 / CBS 615 / JCM 9827 / NBRC 10315 / NRRL Y-1498 / VKM Y-70) TaxID=590646 RepID=G3BAK3_CANTC|nr:uncharacterized protein CANTEDRAFT_114901 [Yamadazyma tenuis ATCC 10573]EGV61425.1 hypothetical protein CANTEDRAFT_114901 [Yamadazyma tenuis ATCC 10573]WEJ92643.1 basic region leucin zipper [Yamadazyma tenuis]
MEYTNYMSKNEFENGDIGLYNDNQFGLTQQNVYMLDEPVQFPGQYIPNADTFSDRSSPSTNNSNLMTVDHAILSNHHGQKSDLEASSTDENSHKVVTLRNGKGKSKKQLAEEQDTLLLSRDDSELTEEELQLKKKAQNRAAQRAFRERKETRLKELEQKLNKSEEDKQALLNKLEAIRKQNLAMKSENSDLKTSRNNGTTPELKLDFPKNEGDFIARLLEGQEHVYSSSDSKKVYDSPENGQKVLAFGAVWDYLLYRADEDNLNIDVMEVMNSLKGNEKCHGYGPAYPVELIDKAILENSSPNDF